MNLTLGLKNIAEEAILDKSDKLDGLNSTQFATTSSNTFNGNQTVNGSITASSGITGSFKGNGSQLTNLTASGWNNNETGFYSDVQDAFIAGSGVNITQTGNKYTIEADIAEFGLSAEGGITGSGTSADPFILEDSINITNNITASNITASNSFYGNLLGTASYASEAADSLALNGYSDTDFALLNNDVEFTTVTASFSGDGSEITGLSSSQIQNFSLDVSNIFVAGNNISIEDNLDGTYTISSSQTLTGSDWSGGTGSFYQDVRSTFTAAGAISISSIAGGRYEISSSGGSGGGGLSTVETSGSITGSGDVSNPVTLKPDIKVDSIEFDKLASDPVTHVTGQIWYNSGSNELKYSTDINNLDVVIGQQVLQKVRNGSGMPLSKGTIVHISGTTYVDTPVVNLADWDNENLSANSLGVIAIDAAVGEKTYVVTQGTLNDINTIGKANGAILYLSSSGQITTTQPVAPKHSVIIGQCINQHASEGIIYVSIKNGYALQDLHDVKIDSKTSGDLLVWDSDDNVWQNSHILSGSYNIQNGALTASYGIKTPSDIISDIKVTYAATASYFAGTQDYALRDSTNTFTADSLNTFNATTTFNAPITGTVAKFTGNETIFTNNIRVDGTASIGLLNTISQNSLQVGDKYITIMSGASDHTTLSGSGILWGSGSAGPTIGPLGSNAYVLYDSGSDKLEIFPGLNVIGDLSASVIYGDGSGIINLTTASINNWATNVRAVITGSNGITISAGTASLSGSGQLTSLTASSHVSASTYYGNGSNLSDISATSARAVTVNYTLNAGTGDSPTIGCIVAISGGLLFKADKNNNSKSNAIGVITNVNDSIYTIALAGDVAINGASAYASTPGIPLYVGTTGSATIYDNIGSGEYITQIGYTSLDTSDSYVILQPRVFGQKA